MTSEYVVMGGDGSIGTFSTALEAHETAIAKSLLHAGRNIAMGGEPHTWPRNEVPGRYVYRNGEFIGLRDKPGIA